MGFGEDWNYSGGLYLPPEPESPSWPIGVDLFCGAGGFGLGFHAAGFHMAAASEWDNAAASTYLVNLGSPDTELVFVGDNAEASWNKWLAQATKRGYGSNRDEWGTGWIANADRGDPENSSACFEPVEVFYLGDCRELTGDRILSDLGLKRGDVAVVTGGPPCQGYSTAGKRDVMDERNSLVFDYGRLVSEIQPTSWVMENVTGILSMVTPNGIPVIDELAARLSGNGYSTIDQIKRTLNAMEAQAAVGVKPASHAVEPEPGTDDEAAQMELAL
jgi:DNA (cytosine-5)-methyltransferase 1